MLLNEIQEKGPEGMSCVVFMTSSVDSKEMTVLFTARNDSQTLPLFVNTISLGLAVAWSV